MKQRAILNIGIEVHGLNQNQECDGHVLANAQLREYGIKPRSVYKMDGETVHDVLTKLKRILDDLK